MDDCGYSKILYEPTEFVPYQPSQEPIFPPELQLKDHFDTEFLQFSNGSVTWFRPTSLDHLLELKKQHPEAKIVVGNTELGVEVKFKHCTYPVYINPSCVPQMSQVFPHLTHRHTINLYIIKIFNFSDLFQQFFFSV